MKVIDFVQHVVAKAVSVGATVFISGAGIDALINYVSAPSPETALALKAVSLVAGYSIWKQAIIPIVEGWFADKKATGAAPKTTSHFFSLT